MKVLIEKYWIPFVDFYLSKSPRERIFISIISSAFIYLTIMIFIHDAIDTSVAQKIKQKISLSNELNQFRVEGKTIQDLDTRITKDDLEKNIQAIDAEYSKAFNDIINFSQTTLSPEKMVIILESILKTQPNIQLTGLENRAPEVIYQEDSEQPSIFKHPFTLKIRANYLDLLSYLRKIEDSPYPIFWESIKIDVSEYPNALNEISVYTFSQSPSFLGINQ